MPTKTKYSTQRDKVTPPHIALGDLRTAVGITLDQLVARIDETAGVKTTRGAISAIENGHRGASVSLLQAIALAYGLRPDAITTSYAPRATAERASA